MCFVCGFESEKHINGEKEKGANVEVEVLFRRNYMVGVTPIVYIIEIFVKLCNTYDYYRYILICIKPFSQKKKKKKRTSHFFFQFFLNLKLIILNLKSSSIHFSIDLFLKKWLFYTSFIYIFIYICFIDSN